MTTKLVTVGPGATAARCAQLMQEGRIKCLPVLREGMLVGIIARADLLRAVLTPPEQLSEEGTQDASIYDSVRREMRAQPWSDSGYISVNVLDGVVTLYGLVRSNAVRRALFVLAERIDGVRRVVDRMDLRPVFARGEWV